MSRILRQILNLIEHRQVKISAHGYDEMAEDDILVKDVLAHVGDAVVVEEYPGYHKGLCVLVLQHDLNEQPIHVVWGIPKDADCPAVLVTAYRPDPARWSKDLLRRKR